MIITNKKNGDDVSDLYFRLMKKEITNEQFEELTGLEPAENNPARAAYLKRNNEHVTN